LPSPLPPNADAFTWLVEPMIEQAGFELERASYGSLRVYADYLCSRITR
jgi:hypothetical protein